MNWSTALPCGVLAAFGSALLLLLMRRVRGTTLVAPACWAIAALTAVAAVECIAATVGDPQAEWLRSLRFAAATVTFCPAMAVLGAKRPQHLAWPIVVASLWAVLALSAGEALLVQPDQPMEIRGLRSWLLPLFIGLGAANYLPTRFWPAALIAAAGQAALLAEHLPHWPPSWGTINAAVGMSLLVASAALAWLIPLRRRTTAHRLDAAWLEFRDCWGLLWGLRVLQRINLVAGQRGWPFRLTWRGFRALRHGDDFEAGVERPPSIEPDAANVFANLLRRFLSRSAVAAMGEVIEADDSDAA